MTDEEIGARIQNMIDDRDTTQTALAKQIGVAQTTLNGYIKGHHKFPPDTFPSIARALNISTDYIFALTDFPDPPIRLSKAEQAMIQILRSLYKDQQEAVHNQVQFSRSRTSENRERPLLKGGFVRCGGDGK